MIQIDNLGVPRVGILNTFAGEYSDSVRFEPYYSEKVGMLAVSGFRAESRPGGEVRFSWDRHPFASRYAS